MPTDDRTTIPGTTDPGDIWTSANVDELPGGWLAWASVTADQTGIAAGAEVDLTGLTETVTVPAGRRLKLTASCNLRRPSAASDGLMLLLIKEGSTYLGGAKRLSGVVSQNQEWHAAPIALVAPSAGAHTYKLTAWNLAAGGTLELKAEANMPAFLLIEDIGPAT